MKMKRNLLKLWGINIKLVFKFILEIVIFIVLLALSPIGITAGLIWISSAWWMWVIFGLSVGFGLFMAWALCSISAHKKYVSEINDGHYV